MKSKHPSGLNNLWVQISSRQCLYFTHSDSCLHLFMLCIPLTVKSFPESWKCFRCLSISHIPHVMTAIFYLFCCFPGSDILFFNSFVCACLLHYCQNPPREHQMLQKWYLLEFWKYFIVEDLNLSHVAWKNKENGPALQSVLLFVTWDIYLVHCTLHLTRFLGETAFSAATCSPLSKGVAPIWEAGKPSPHCPLYLLP